MAEAASRVQAARDLHTFTAVRAAFGADEDAARDYVQELRGQMVGRTEQDKWAQGQAGLSALLKGQRHG